MAYTLGIDVGTQSTKVLIYDTALKKIVVKEQESYDLVSRPDGSREQEASWWTTAITQCCARLDPHLLKHVSAVGVSGQQHGFVPLDHGQVLHRVKLWCDTSTVTQCEELTEAFGGNSRLLDEAGNLILPGYTLPKILWFKQFEPSLYQKMTSFALPHNYINFWLTSQLNMEFGDASGTGFLNIRTRSWNFELLKLIDSTRDWQSFVPPLVQAHEPSGFVTEKAAKNLGLTPGIPVSSGGGDNMMAAIGTGSVRPGVVTISLGTSGTLFTTADHPVIDPNGQMAGFCSSTGGWLPLYCTMNCTVASELTRKLLGTDLTELNRQAASVPAGSDGVLLLPFFNGERTPYLPHGKGSFLGLTPDTMTPAHLLRASLEGAVYGLKTGLQAFVELGLPVNEIRLTGGGSASPLWRQIVADILALPVVYPSEQEAACLGAALQAEWCRELQASPPSHVSAPSHEGQEYEARLLSLVDQHVLTDATKTAFPSQNQHVYSQAYENYLGYLRALTPVFQ
ncbi:MAG: xylulokinase [Spirochaetales bacterium]|nr:xylulokinase [Spirochaetales bacterium]